MDKGIALQRASYKERIWVLDSRRILLFITIPSGSLQLIPALYGPLAASWLSTNSSLVFSIAMFCPVFTLFESEQQEQAVYYRYYVCGRITALIIFNRREYPKKMLVTVG